MRRVIDMALKIEGMPRQTGMHAAVFDAVFLSDVFNSLLTPVSAEVYIEVRHRNTIGVKKTLEKQIIL